MTAQTVFQVITYCTLNILNVQSYTIYLIDCVIFLSGERDCEDKVCGEPGQCIDVANGLTQTPSVDDCISLCNADAFCGYWSFESDAGLCMLFKECKEVDEVTCPTCVYGERECTINPGIFICCST